MQALRSQSISVYIELKYKSFLIQETNKHFQKIGMKSSLPEYCPSRAVKNYLKELLTPGKYVDWMALNLYLHILVLDQSLPRDTLTHIPWDYIDTTGISSSDTVDDVMGQFERSAFNYPQSWVCQDVIFVDLHSHTT